jgi:hypothetical protein
MRIESSFKDVGVLRKCDDRSTFRMARIRFITPVQFSIVTCKNSSHFQILRCQLANFFVLLRRHPFQSTFYSRLKYQSRSVRIALVSYVTHAPLPQSIKEANRHFVAPKEYGEWKTKTTNHDWEAQKLTCNPQTVKCKTSRDGDRYQRRNE